MMIDGVGTHLSACISGQSEGPSAPAEGSHRIYEADLDPQE